MRMWENEKTLVLFLTPSFRIPHIVRWYVTNHWVDTTCWLNIITHHHLIHSYRSAVGIRERMWPHSQTGSLGMRLCLIHELWTAVAMQ